MSSEIQAEQHGLVALEAMFKRAESENRAAFMPYFPIGYPNYDTSLEAIAVMAEADVDGFEIGVPFSDPLADGPTIQEATQIALENGMTVRKCLEAVKMLRGQGVDQPMMLMSYANPLVAYGTDDFVRDAKAAGADGLIVPDLPPEEAHYFSDACQREGLALIFFLAPTSNEKRIQMTAQHATGFIYVVSLAGVTGARTELPEYLTSFIARLRQHTNTPLVLGFGISTPEHAQQMHGLVDGYIVGSALVRAAKQGVDAVKELVTSLRQVSD